MQFLKTCQLSKTDDGTIVGSPNVVNLSGGKFSVSNEKYPKFLEIYSTLLKRSRILFLAEKPIYGQPKYLYFDFDFKYQGELKRLYKHSQIQKVVKIIQKELKKLLSKSYDSQEMSHITKCILQEKSGPRMDREKVKDGFHLLFPNFIYSSIMPGGISIVNFQFLEKMIIHRVSKRVNEVFKKIPIVNKDVIDEMGGTNWLMYGARKPCSECKRKIFSSEYDDSNPQPLDNYTCKSCFDIPLETYKITKAYQLNCETECKKCKKCKKEQQQHKCCCCGECDCQNVIIEWQDVFDHQVTEDMLPIALSIRKSQSQVIKLNSSISQFLKEFVTKMGNELKQPIGYNLPNRSNRVQPIERIPVDDRFHRVLKGLLDILTEEYTDDYHLWLRVGFILYFETNGSADGLDLWDEFSSRNPKYIEGCCDKKWRSFHKDHHDPVTIGTMLKWTCEINRDAVNILLTPLESLRLQVRSLTRRYSGQRITLKDAKTFDTPIHDFVDIINSPQSEFCTTLIRAGMSMGKTEKLKEYVEAVAAPLTPPGASGAATTPNQARRYNHTVVLTSRQFLARDLSDRLPDWYRHYKDDDIMDEHFIIKCAHLIISVESLRRFQTLSDEELKNTILVLDEVDSILKQLNSVTMNGCEESAKAFYRMLSKCGNVIGMSADLEDSTVELLKLLRPKENFIVHHYTNQIESDKLSTHHIYFEEQQWLSVLKSHVLQNQKIVIPCTSQKLGETCINMIRRMEESHLIPHKNIIFIYSDMNREEKQTILQDISKAFQECDILIYTPSITRGLSFDLEHFDVVFTYICPLVPLIPQDIRQMMRRCRKIRSNQYHVYMRPHYSNLPTTEKEIVRRMSITQASSYYLKDDGNIQETYIDEFGDRKLAYHYHKDPHYYVTMHNILIENKCVNNYLETYIHQVSDTGAKIIIANEVELDYEGMRDDRAYDSLKKENDKIARADEISHAKNITKEEYNDLRVQTIITNDQQRQVEKYNLVSFYDVSPLDITRMFVLSYNDKRVRSRYLNISYFYRIYQKYRGDMIKVLKYTKSVDRELLDDNANFITQHYALLQVDAHKHELCHLMVSWCGFRDIFDMTTTIANADHIFNNFMTHRTKLKKYYDDFMVTFKISYNYSKFLQKINNSAKLLTWINTKLFGMYGLKIQCEENDNTRVRHNYHIVHTDFPTYRKDGDHHGYKGLQESIMSLLDVDHGGEQDND